MEKAPRIPQEDLLRAMALPQSEAVSAAVSKANDTFEYWDTLKYEPCPEGYTPAKLWTCVKASRAKGAIRAWPHYGVTLSLTNRMQRICHEIDMNWGGSWGNGSPLGKEGRERYLASSLMEEAIYSSQMEGAATTRKVAKEMLRKKMTPRDKSQQMIYNNYQTVRFIVDNKDKPLSADLLLHVHRLMTERTMQDEQDAGRFRTNNDVVVENGITHETAHTPPSYEQIPGFVNDLCHFFNEDDNRQFVHPIIRGIIIHFMVAYVHPFSDGNGRTARALFYWYMLRQGYWLTEYLSISRVIARSKKAYEKAFLYTEADGMDIGYFVAYNLRVLQQSFAQLQDYIRRKQAERSEASAFLRIEGVNARQSQLIKMLMDAPQTVLTVGDVQARFMVSPTTAKADIVGLMRKGILSEFSFNKVKKGYVKGERFNEVVGLA